MKETYDYELVGNLNDYDNDDYVLFSSLLNEDDYNSIVESEIPGILKDELKSEFTSFVMDNDQTELYGVSGHGYNKIDNVYKIIFNKTYDIYDVLKADSILTPLECFKCGHLEVINHYKTVSDAHCTVCGTWQRNLERDIKYLV